MKLKEIIFLAEKFEMNLDDVEIYDHTIIAKNKRIDIFTEIDIFGRMLTTKIQYWKDYKHDWSNYIIIDEADIIVDTSF